MSPLSPTAAGAHQGVEGSDGVDEVSKMIERLSQRATRVASQMEAQAANFNQQVRSVRSGHNISTLSTCQHPESVKGLR